MVQVINRKTQLPYTFSNEDWQLLKDKGLHRKYKVQSQTEDKSSATPTYTPPELNGEVKEVKPEGNKVIGKKKTAR